MAETIHTNRLIQETSPYLRQHAHNPVDWYPWGPEALERAKTESKPIFLSIGYSACHWCHVMERESFEDPETARLMNELFVNIKVDREERPDLDQIYMNAVQLMTQHGGWPMSVWLTPRGEPFYGGTYFPPEPRFNMPAFRQVMQGVANAWQTRPGDVASAATEMVRRLDQLGKVEGEEGPLTVALIEQAGQQIDHMIDLRWGGLGRAPKFPHSVELRLLLRSAQRTGKEDQSEHALFSLEQMIRGGIYDQLGGGFHRYSTDERWLAPHFEKMLYDNALIPLASIEAWQVTGKAVFRQATEETLDYVLREMTSPVGAFYSAQDADSEGEEGKFYVWSRTEIGDILGPAQADVFCYCYDVTEQGNWEGVNILHRPKTLEQASKLLKLPLDELETTLARSRSILLEARSKRVWPGLDDKALTSWNAMMIDTMSVASQVFEIDRYAQAAARAADFLLLTMRSPGGLLLRTYNEGTAKLNAYLEDYSFLANALVSLYEATFDQRWITAALEIVDRMIEQFWDDKDGGFYYTGMAHEALIARGKEPTEGAIPSGNSMAVTAMARLAKLTGRNDLFEKSERTFKLFRSIMAKSATAAAQSLIALGIHLGPTYEFAIVGDPEAEETRQILRSLHRRFLPNKVVAVGVPGRASGVPLLEGKSAPSGKPTVYVCRDFACQAPLVGAEAFEAELERLTRYAE